MRESDKILHDTFVSCGAKAKEWTRKCILLLPEIEKREIWQKKGFGSIYEYSAKLAGISRNAVDDALRILRKIEDKPALQKIAEEKGIGAVRPVATIATCGTADFWAEKAKIMSKHTLETYVKEIRKSNLVTADNIGYGRSLFEDNDAEKMRSNDNSVNDQDNTSIEKIRPGTARTKPFDTAQGKLRGVRLLCQSIQPENIPNDLQNRTSVTLTMDLDPNVAEKLSKLKGTGTWNDLMRTLLVQHEAQMEAEKPIPVETESRHIPAAIKKYVLAKTNGTCAFPGCTKPHAILHHTKRFALSRCHDPDHIAPLCTAHERLAHLSLIESEEHAPSHWKIRLQPETHDLKHMIDQRVAAHRDRTMRRSRLAPP